MLLKPKVANLRKSRRESDGVDISKYKTKP
jgi:hypothetical protein